MRLQGKTALVTAYYCLAAGAVGYFMTYGVRLTGIIYTDLLIALLVGVVVWMRNRDKHLPDAPDHRPVEA